MRSSPTPQANNITQIVIGKSDRSRWFEMMHGSVVHDLVRKTGPISVHVISAEADEIRSAEIDADRAGAPSLSTRSPYLGSAGGGRCRSRYRRADHAASSGLRASRWYF